MAQTAAPSDLASTVPLHSAFSGRALAVGVLSVVVIGWGCPYATFAIQGSYVDLDF